MGETIGGSLSDLCTSGLHGLACVPVVQGQKACSGQAIALTGALWCHHHTA